MEFSAEDSAQIEEFLAIMRRLDSTVGRLEGRQIQIEAKLDRLLHNLEYPPLPQHVHREHVLPASARRETETYRPTASTAGDDIAAAPD